MIAWYTSDQMYPTNYQVGLGSIVSMKGEGKLREVECENDD